MLNIKRVDMTISTEKLQESKAFYIGHFGFKLFFESDWYIELVTPEGNAGISFTLPQREEGEFFNGRGIVFSLEVEDADREYNRLKAEGVSIYQGIQNKPWGERSFVVDDPNGVHVYVYTLTERTEEYKRLYDKFQAK